MFPLPSASQMVGTRKSNLSSQFDQVPDTPTNFHRPSTSRSTKLAKALDPLKESGSSMVTSITYLRHLLILSTMFQPNLSTLSVFPRFPASPPTPPNFTKSGRDLKLQL